MKRITAFLAVVAAAAHILNLHAADTRNIHTERDERDVLQLESQWTKAMQAGDAAALERILAPNYTSIDGSGQAMGKAQEIAMYTSGDLKFTSLETSEQTVKIYHGGAVVIGKASVKGKYKGEDFSGEYRFVDIFEPKRGGGWHAVFSQLTKVETEADKKKKEDAKKETKQ